MATSRQKHPANITEAASVIRDATALIVTCGAGMGVDSGMPDFRGKQGFWKAFPVLKDRNIDLASMSTPGWFDKDPDFAWGFFGYRYNMYNSTKPHAGFNILRKWGERKANEYFVFTSNVDGHFQKAGFDEDHVVECHGSIHHLQCIDPSANSEIWDMPPGVKFVIDDQLRAQPPHPMGPPGTNNCMARPNILMFGDWTWVDSRTDAQHTRWSRYLRGLAQDSRTRTVVVEIGSGRAVPTVRMTSERIITDVPNAKLVRINVSPDDSVVPPGNISLQMGGLAALQAIDDILETERENSTL